MNYADVRQELVFGKKKPANKAILDYIEQHPVDLVVLGTQGHHGVTSKLLGSTADTVVDSAQCDVLVITAVNSDVE